jgi:Arc/MetJ-type ribon-helix-helix transcriptional regulator
MTIHLTPEQERRLQAVIRCGAYGSVDEVMEAALAAVEQRLAPDLEGTEEELEKLLLAGLASRELTEQEFWESVNGQTEAMLADEAAPHP